MKLRRTKKTVPFLGPPCASKIEAKYRTFTTVKFRNLGKGGRNVRVSFFVPDSISDTHHIFRGGGRCAVWVVRNSTAPKWKAFDIRRAA